MKLTREEIEKAVREIISEIACVDIEDTTTVDSLGLDSLDAVDIIIDLEETLGVMIENSEAEAVQDSWTMRQVLDHAVKTLEAKSVYEMCSCFQQAIIGF